MCRLTHASPEENSCVRGTTCSKHWRRVTCGHGAEGRVCPGTLTLLAVVGARWRAPPLECRHSAVVIATTVTLASYTVYQLNRFPVLRIGLQHPPVPQIHPLTFCPDCHSSAEPPPFASSSRAVYLARFQTAPSLIHDICKVSSRFGKLSLANQIHTRLTGLGQASKGSPSFRQQFKEEIPYRKGYSKF